MWTFLSRSLSLSLSFGLPCEHSSPDHCHYHYHSVSHVSIPLQITVIIIIILSPMSTFLSRSLSLSFCLPCQHSSPDRRADWDRNHRWRLRRPLDSGDWPGEPGWARPHLSRLAGHHLQEAGGGGRQAGAGARGQARLRHGRGGRDARHQVLAGLWSAHQITSAYFSSLLRWDRGGGHQGGGGQAERQVRPGAPGDPDPGGRLVTSETSWPSPAPWWRQVSRASPQLRVPVPGRGLHRDARGQGLGPQPRPAHPPGVQIHGGSLGGEVPQEADLAETLQGVAKVRRLQYCANCSSHYILRF